MSDITPEEAFTLNNPSPELQAAADEYLAAKLRERQAIQATMDAVLACETGECIVPYFMDQVRANVHGEDEASQSLYATAMVGTFLLTAND